MRTGFTLIEMLIVLAIIGVLAAVAYPAYTSQVARSKRSDAQTVLLEAAQYMQRYYAAQNTFTSASLPTVLSRAPKDTSSTKAYDVTLTVPTGGATFTLTAAPSGWTDAVCGSLTLTDAGVKGLSGTYSGTVGTCWR